jgi:hypothetical protein
LNFFNATKSKESTKLVKIPDTDQELKIHKLTFQQCSEYNAMLNSISYESSAADIKNQKIKMDGRTFSLNKLSADVYLLSESLKVPESVIEDSSIDIKTVEYLVAKIKEWNGMDLSEKEIEDFINEDTELKPSTSTD